MPDVIIIGGGPAGSTLGSYLSMRGISNLIVEKANHPREHVGESLVTNTNRVFQEIGFIPTMEKDGFIKKYGAAWHAPNHASVLSIVFAEFPVEGINQPYSYHVDRKMFDLHLLKHAEILGSQVSQGVTVVKLLTNDDGSACGVRARIGSEEVDLTSKIVVDASGRDTFLGRNLRLKEKDPLFDQYAIHAWYENVDRGDEKTADFIHIYFLPLERGWVWQIPISEEVTSIGVVTEKRDFKASRMGLEKYFNKHLKINQNLVRAMKNARRVNEFTTEGDYSYSLRRFVGDGFLIVGDAARFVDPIFSSGISVAMHSAKFASEAIAEALEKGDYSEAAFLNYEAKLKQGCEIWYEFIRLYYKLLPLFTRFIQSPKYRKQIHRLLQGEVFDREEAPVLDAMRKFIEQVEKAENHLLKQQLADIPIDSTYSELLKFNTLSETL